MVARTATVSLFLHFEMKEMFFFIKHNLISIFSGDFAQHVKIWPERCSMTGSSFDVNFGSISNKWDRDGTPYDFGSIMHYR